MRSVLQRPSWQPRSIATFSLAVLLLTAYLAFPTRNHYWDGIGFALNIEGVSQDMAGFHPERPAGTIYYNPNHLLFNWTGRILYRAVNVLTPGARALDILVLWSTVSSVLAVCLLFRLILQATGYLWLSLWSALLMGLSASWWKFSTDADAYVPSAALLVVCAWLLHRSKPHPVWTGLAHAAAILLHQIAVCFFPAAVIALLLRRPPAGHHRWRAAFVYAAVAGSITLAAYVCIWTVALENTWDLPAFARWTTFNSTDVLVRKSLTARMGDMALATLRTFFGGRLSLAWKFGGLAIVAPTILLSAGALCRLFRRSKSAAVPEPSGERWPPDIWFPAAWLGAFLLFLSVWLTEYPYYRILCLPGFVLLSSRLIATRWSEQGWSFHRLPAFVVLMASVNFALYVYPYSRSESTPATRVALEARGRWENQPVVVYYRDFNCDNWWMKYFNMHTTWRKANLDAGRLLLSEIALTASSHRIFLDGTLIRHLENHPEYAELGLVDRFLHPPWGLVTSEHHLLFAEVRR